MIQYDMIRYTIFTCAKKLTNSQLSLPHGTKKRVMKELKTKIEILRRNGPVSHKVRVVRPEAGRETVVGKICEIIGFEPGVKERGSYGW